MPRSDHKIYVGNLPGDVREKEVEEIFQKYGRISCVDLKTGRGASFAFIQFEDSRDAEDAIHGRNGYEFDGSRLRVEFTRGVGPRGPGGRPLNGSFGGRDSHRSSRRFGYRVIVERLPSSGSWQDLKDHMREAGEICYADVTRNGTGVVEYLRHDDAKYAVKKLDDTKFKSHTGESAIIRVRVDNTSDFRRDGRTPPRSDRRSSPKYSRSRSRTRSPSRSRSRSESRSRSRSRSRTPVRSSRR